MSGGNETDLLSRHGSSSSSRRETDVLMVTSTVWVINRVHGDTSDNRPAVALGLVLVVGVSGLEKGLVSPSSSGDDSNHGTGVAWDNNLST